MFGYNPQLSIDKINQQIQDLERIKNGYQSMIQQPIQNIINTNSQNIDFEARFINENDNVEDLLVQRKTAFINLKKGELSIKETNGDITTYDISKQKTPEELRIEELERKLSIYEQQSNQTDNEIKQSGTNDTKQHDTGTKAGGRNVFKKSE